MMQKLSRADLMSLEAYSEARPDFRARVIAHKRNRQVRLGPHATLYFEDRLTMQYQIQEMLRIERVFETAGIQEELDAYNPLIPDGENWKATFMIEYDDPEERKVALERLLGIEDRVWVQVVDGERCYAIADEDSSATVTKRSAAHFMRFELRRRCRCGQECATVAMGIDLDAYNHTVAAVPDNVRDCLAGDLT